MRSQKQSINMTKYSSFIKYAVEKAIESQKESLTTSSHESLEYGDQWALGSPFTNGEEQFIHFVDNSTTPSTLIVKCIVTGFERDVT